MDPFYDRLLGQTATIDELLSDDFEPLSGQKTETDLAARRLAAWCRSCASGDWRLFSRRLSRDGLDLEQVLTRFATVRRRPSAPRPAWLDDAVWIERALQTPGQSGEAQRFDPTQAAPFEHLFPELLQRADELIESSLGPAVFNRLTLAARNGLRRSLRNKLSDLCTPAVYERFCDFRNSPRPPVKESAPASRYHQFVGEMQAGGFRRLFEQRPVLLKLIALSVRQWVDTTREFLQRLHADLPAIRREILDAGSDAAVAAIEDGLSDPHNGGHSVLVVVFEDGARVVYKPKDVRLDRAWYRLVATLNQAGPPVLLRAPRTMACEGYGWAEYIVHAGCSGSEDCKLFFRRAGALLAVFHCLAATDMHQENLIASGNDPVPIDLEMLLQPRAVERDSDDPAAQAFDAAMDILENSVMAVGLLPSYSRSFDHRVFAVGGLTPDWSARIAIKWNGLNSDEMRPFKSKEGGDSNPNLPHVAGRYATFGDYIEDFLSGFEEYAGFLSRLIRAGREDELLRGFAGLPVRKVVRPTRFYHMLLQRLKDYRSMDDGAVWSAQADFIARLADWETDFDPLWPLQRAERNALVSLNIPYFLFSGDAAKITDAAEWSVPAAATSGLGRARARLRALDEREIGWQVEVIRENTKSLAKAPQRQPARSGLRAQLQPEPPLAAGRETFTLEVERIAQRLTDLAIRRGTSAAWIGLDWLGDAEVFQLTCLGPTLYNGNSGIALFLAAHAKFSGSDRSHEMALAAVAHIRRNLRGRNAARVARSLGIGAAAGLGSIIYALAEMSKRLRDDDLLADAVNAAGLIGDELIAADRQLDVIGGSAGAILALLRLHRDTQLPDVLKTAEKCGEHLLAQPRSGEPGSRSWVVQGLGAERLTGMSHGAAGFAYALASLSAATGREDFRQAASECIAFEDSNYDLRRHNWPDFRGGGDPTWPCQWCHGAVGIGLARLGAYKRRSPDADRLLQDVRRAVDGAKQAGPRSVDTLCCGTLGGVELFCEAAEILGCSDLRALGAHRLETLIQTARSDGDYKWNSGPEKFNLGLFRGLAGVGYTLLRQLDDSLPNVLIWD